MNFAILSQVYKNKDLRKRVGIILLVLFCYSLLTHIPVPVPQTTKLQSFLLNLFSQNPLLGFANLFTGGAMTNFSVIMMGLGPFINASIIIQLLSQVVPKFEALNKEGEAGRRKLNQYTRLLTVPLAFIQSIAMVLFVQQTSIKISGVDLIGKPTLAQWILMVTTIAAGSMLLMWLGEIITEYGVGNGISILIFAGIASSLPTTIARQFSLAEGSSIQIFTFIGVLLLSVASILFVVLINEAQRNIPVSYARRTTTGAASYGSVDTHLPLRLITAGVIPIIFALAFLSIPGFIGQLFSNAKSAWLAHFAATLAKVFQPGQLVYEISYFVLIFAFTFFYTSIVFKPAEIAENLQKQGGFIPGIRPGKETAAYLKRIINRITFAGASALAIIAILPFILQSVLKTSQVMVIGGTGLLIVVAVVIETMKQIEARALMATYDKY